MKSIASKTLALGLTLAFLATGCSKAPTELTDDAAKNSLGISNVTSIAHNQSPVSESEYGSNYTAQDKVSVTYSVDLADGLLNQTVTKEACFYFDRTYVKFDLGGISQCYCKQVFVFRLNCFDKRLCTISKLHPLILRYN